MIKFVDGDLFESDCDILVNTVNCVGVMGKGIAKEFKIRYPNMFMAYRASCRYNQVQLGKIWKYNYSDNYTYFSYPWIWCLPTKNHWRNKSSYEIVESGIIALGKDLEALDTTICWSIAIPALGCNCGGLLWDRVKFLIKFHLDGLDNIIIKVYNPKD